MKIKLPEQIETPKLILKKHSLDPAYIQLWVDSINQNLGWLSQFLPRFSETMTFEKEKAFLESVLTEEKEIGYGVWNKETNELMGSIGAFNFEEKDQKSSIELGVILFQKFAGMGYAPEAMKFLEQELFSAGIDGVMAKIDEKNTRSRRAAIKAGFSWNGQETKASRNSPDKMLLVYRKQIGDSRS